ncbi:MAG: malectin domain-containing carbohydrate-binding protein [Pseudomonadota bacterium]
MRLGIIFTALLFSQPSFAQSNFETKYINIGGPEITWEENTWFAGNTVVLEGTDYRDPPNSPSGIQEGFAGTIYETQSYSNQAVKLSILVPSGQYELDLHFAELWHADGSVGSRVFDVVIEDQVVGSGIDILEATGGRANDQFIAEIGGVQPDFNDNSNTIDIEIRSVRDNAVLNGISISCAGGATCVWPAETQQQQSTMSLSEVEADTTAPETSNSVVELEGGPVIGAYNLAGPAMVYGDISFEADAFATSRSTGVEGEGNSGPNGLQETIIDTPFASVRWGSEITFAAPVEPGPVTVDLYFVEGWWAESGNRIMNIEIEGNLIRENYDILADANNDFNAPQILRFKDIDPSQSGDPQSIEIRVSTVKDNAVLSAVVLRGCDADAATCEARIAEAAAEREAEEERLKAEAEAAAKALELANRKPVIASYGREYSIRLDSGPWVARSIVLRFSLYGLEDGIVLHVTDKNINYYDRLLGLDGSGQRVNCAVFFSQAEVFSEAEYLGDTCGETSGPFEITASVEEGRKGLPEIVGRLGGVNYTFKLDGPWDLPGAAMNALPSNRPDFKGVVFEPDIENLKKQIENAIYDVQPQAEWIETEYDGYGVLSLSSPSTDAPEPVDTFQIYTASIDGKQLAWGFSRRWYPPEDARPFSDQFDEAIFSKYGEPSGEFRNPDRFASHARIGWVWSLDENGVKGDQDKAYECMWEFVNRDKNPARKWIGTQNWRDATAPLILAREGCGYQMTISPAVFRSDNRVRNVIFFYHDPNIAEIVRWNQARALGQALLDNESVRAAATEKLKSVGPDAPKKDLDL